jgi:ADP-heptose:LPS heptosyltransferase
VSAEGGAKRILIIKLGALGDLVQAMGSAAAIREFHRGAEIVLLTGAAYADFARQAPYFDAVWADQRPGPANLAALLRLWRRLRRGRFDRVYDLQTRARTTLYFWLMRRGLLPGAPPEWSGTAWGCSHPHDNPARGRMHTLDREADQLRRAGIPGPIAPPDLSWASADIGRFELPANYVLLIPGSAPHRPEKRWPVERFSKLAAKIAAAGLTPVVIGGPGERDLGLTIARAVPQARDLTGATDFADIAVLGRDARRVIGNDTGPTHLAVAGGAPATVLFSRASDPDLTAPRGPDVVILRAANLADLPVEAVARMLGLAP